MLWNIEEIWKHILVSQVNSFRCKYLLQFMSTVSKVEEEKQIIKKIYKKIINKPNCIEECIYISPVVLQSLVYLNTDETKKKSQNAFNVI